MDENEKEIIHGISTMLTAEKYIQETYDDLFEKIKGAKLYGMDIDLKNPVHVAVAMAMYAEMKRMEIDWGKLNKDDICPSPNLSPRGEG